MPIPDGTKIGVSTETPSLYFDSFLIAFVVSQKQNWHYLSLYLQPAPNRFLSGDAK